MFLIDTTNQRKIALEWLTFEKEERPQKRQIPSLQATELLLKWRIAINDWLFDARNADSIRDTLLDFDSRVIPSASGDDDFGFLMVIHRSLPVGK
jgi:hypothetical protein